MSQSPELIEAFGLIKGGQPAAAAQVLTHYISQHPRDADAWWLMAHTVSQPDKVEQCLQNVLKINPQHVQAQVKLAKLNEARRPAPADDLGDPFAELVAQPGKAAVPAPRPASKRGSANTEMMIGLAVIGIAIVALIGVGIWVAQKQGWFSRSAKSTVEAFYDAIGDKNAGKVYELSCTQSDQGERRLKSVFDSIDQLTVADLAIRELKKTGDAVEYNVDVSFQVVYESGAEMKASHVIFLDLKKEDGRWCVDLENPDGLSSPVAILKE